MVDFRVLFYLYRNRNISGIIENKKDFYMTVLVEGYNVIYHKKCLNRYISSGKHA